MALEISRLCFSELVEHFVPFVEMFHEIEHFDCLVAVLKYVCHYYLNL